jgi:hypothetical protein
MKTMILSLVSISTHHARNGKNSKWEPLLIQVLRKSSRSSFSSRERSKKTAGSTKLVVFLWLLFHTNKSITKSDPGSLAVPFRQGGLGGGDY